MTAGGLQRAIDSAAPSGRVLALLPRGEAIRTHVYSGALDHVAEHIPVHLGSVDPSPEVWDLLERRFASATRLISTTESRAIRLLREALETAHTRWVRSEAARERWRRRDMEASSGAATAKNLLKRELTRPLANPTSLHMLDRAYERASLRAPRPSEADLLDEIRPSLVFNTSHVHSRIAEPLVMQARRQRIPTAAFLFSWDNLTSQGRIVPRYDSYLAWNEHIRHDLLRIYPHVDPEAVMVTGTPQFDFHFWPEMAWSRARLCAEIGADPNRPLVLYTTGMPNHMPDEQWIVQDLADRLRAGGDAQLVVRVYAKDRSGRFDNLMARRSDIVFAPSYWEQNWLTPLPNDTPLLTNLLRHADVGVNVASTVSLELCMFDRPVVNVAYNPPTVKKGTIDYAAYYAFDHYRPVVQSGAVELASSPDELDSAVRTALAVPSAASAARRTLLEGMFGPTLDGRSHERVAAAILRLAGIAG